MEQTTLLGVPYYLLNIAKYYGISKRPGLENKKEYNKSTNRV